MRLAIALWAKFAHKAERRTSSAPWRRTRTPRPRKGTRRGRAAAAGHRGRQHSYGRTRAPLDADLRLELTLPLSRLGEYAEAAVLLWTTFAVRTPTVGVDDEGTLVTESYFIINALLSLREYAEA